MEDHYVSTSQCSHCQREVPASNFDLHIAHCKRNLERCNVCGEMVPRTHADEHYNNFHAPVKCPLCNDMMDRELLSVHQNEKCPQRMVACGFCDFPVAATDLDAHTDHCGNRTEMCLPCGKYVRLRERSFHDLQYHSDSQVANAPIVRNNIPQSLPSSNSPSRVKLLVTLAITGVAVVIGAFALQKSETH